MTVWGPGCADWLVCSLNSKLLKEAAGVRTEKKNGPETSRLSSARLGGEREVELALGGVKQPPRKHLVDCPLQETVPLQSILPALKRPGSLSLLGF